MQNLTDHELMQEYRQGNMLVMDEILRRYKNPVYRFLCRLSSNSAEAADITQEVFLRVHQNRLEYKPIGKFSTWLFGIAHNLFISSVRKKKWLSIWPTKQDGSDDQVEFESLDPSPDQIVEEDEFAKVMKECIKKLPFLQSEALILREYEKMDYQEIARILKVSPAAVKTLIYRARQNLKDKLLPYMREMQGGSNE